MLRFTMNPFNATYVSILDFYNGSFLPFAKEQG